MDLPFAGGHGPGRSADQSPQTCINFFNEPPSQAGDPPHLIGTPGFALLPALAPPHAAQVRGIYWLGEGAFRDEIVVVVGNRVYTYDMQLNIWTDRNAAARLGSTTGTVDIAYNGASSGELWIATGAQLAVFDRSAPSFVINATFTAGANTACFIDGYLIADDRANTGRFYYSDLYNGNSVNPFSFATAEGSTDRLLAVRANRRELWLLGESSTEVWFSSGDGNLPFQRFQGGFVEMGIAAPLTAVAVDNTMMWLAKDRQGQLQVVRASDGYQPTVVSTTELNYLWSSYRYLNVGVGQFAFACTYQIGGHACYVLTFTNYDGASSRATFVYDVTTKLWHQWRTGENQGHLLNCMAYFGSNILTAPTTDGGILIGDSAANGNIYLLKESTYTENGAYIYRERTLPVFRSDRKKVRVAMVEVDMGDLTGTSQTASTTVANLVGIAQGATSVDLAAAGTVAIGDAIRITLDNGWKHFALVTNVVGATVTFADSPTPAAAALGNAILCNATNKVTLTWAKDDAINFVTPITLNDKSQTRALTGQDRGPLRWKKLGMAREWTFRLAVVGRVQATINRIYAHLAGERAPL